jgi:hypothetical protein
MSIRHWPTSEWHVRAVGLITPTPKLGLAGAGRGGVGSREHDAEVGTTVIVPPFANAGNSVAHCEVNFAWRLDRGGKRKEIPGAGSFRSGAYEACLSLGDGRPAVGGEAHGNALLEGDIAHAYDAAEERELRGEEGEGL